MLPAPYYQLNYDEKSGEILAFWNPNNGKCPMSPTILISLEQHEEVMKNVTRYRVENGKIVEKSEGEVVGEPVTVKDVRNSLIAGLVIDGVCYAIEANGLSILLLSLTQLNETAKALTYTKEGNRIVELSRSDAENVASKIAEHLSDLYCG